MPSVGIIGGGVAGCATALELANKGYEVTLFEGKTELLSESSDATSHCFGLGFYYLEPSAAQFSLENVIRLIRYFDTHLSPEQNEGLHLNASTVTYVISKRSRVLPEEIINRFEGLKRHYEALIESDPKNAVLGPAQDFFKVREFDAFSSLINLDEVALIIETCDSLFDWNKLKQQLIKAIEDNKNIHLQLGQSVEAIEYGKVENNQLKTGVRLKQIKATPTPLSTPTTPTFRGLSAESMPAQAPNPQTLYFDELINAAWQNVDRLNQSAGFQTESQVDNQWMLISTLQLPPALHNRSFFIGHPNQLFLTSGPDGLGYLTYSPVSYRGKSASLREEGQEAHFIRTLDEQKEELGEQMRLGAAFHIPGLKEARTLEVKVGVIRASKPSENKVAYRGVRTVAPGLISNEARQHTFWLENARQVGAMIEANQDCKAHFVEALGRLVDENRAFFMAKPGLLNVVACRLAQSVIDFSGRKEGPNFCQAFFAKRELNAQIEAAGLSLE